MLTHEFIVGLKTIEGDIALFGAVGMAIETVFGEDRLDFFAVSLHGFRRDGSNRSAQNGEHQNGSRPRPTSRNVTDPFSGSPAGFLHKAFLGAVRSQRIGPPLAYTQ